MPLHNKKHLKLSICEDIYSQKSSNGDLMQPFYTIGTWISP